MKSSATLRKLYHLLPAVLASVILVIVHLNLKAYAFDDAYIHFRIASHLVDYGTPYYNQGEAVMASSSTAWTILLALCVRLSALLGKPANLPVIASVINALASLGGAYIFTRVFVLLLQKPANRVVKVIFPLVYLALILPTSIGLMETPTAMLLAGITLFLVVKRNRWGLICLGALTFFRPELVIVAGLAVLYILITRRFSLITTVLFCLLGAIPFIIYEISFFRTLVPNTVFAKSIVYAMTTLASLRYFISRLYSSLSGFQIFLDISQLLKIYYAGYVLWVFISLLLVYIYTTVRQALKSRQVNEKTLLGMLFVLWGVCVASLYLYKRILIFTWYDPLYTIPLWVILAKIISDTDPPTAAAVFGVMSLPLVMVQGFVLMQIGMGAFIDPKYAPEFLSSARVRNYIEVGKQLYAHYPHASLMTAEIGGIGYGFQGTIYDGVGLVSPEALKYHPIPNAIAVGGIPAGFVHEKHPDLIVGYDPFLQDLYHDDTLDDYVLIKYPLLLQDDLERVNSRQVYNSDGLKVYVRKGLTP